MAIDTGEPQSASMQEYYRAMYSTILAAHMAGFFVEVVGTGTCSIHGNAETIESLSIGIGE